MTKVITYGTYDLLHYGHIRLLERAKALGDYLIVGVTADNFDLARGKINVQQSLMERIEAVRSTGIADEIIIEEYEGQKIDDIRRYGVDIFTVGSDWVGKFDYLNEFCKVVYLDRTQGVSSSDLRDNKRSIRLGLVGDSIFLNKIFTEAKFVNGIHINALCTKSLDIYANTFSSAISNVTDNYSEMLPYIDAVYIRSQPENHYHQIKTALNKGKHVLCESPIVLCRHQCEELYDLATKNNLVLMEAIKTAYSTAYSRLLLLIKTGKIGDVISVDTICTSIRKSKSFGEWNNIYEWGPTAILPILQILGTNYKTMQIVSKLHDDGSDCFTKIDFTYDHTVGSIKIGDGVKSEGCMMVSGTQGYIYVPAPWWKTDYFEVRYENSTENQRYFYQLDGEGIRYELVAFTKAVELNVVNTSINRDVTLKLAEIMGKFNEKDNMTII